MSVSSWAVNLKGATFNVECLGNLDTSLPAFQPPTFPLETTSMLIRPALVTAVGPHPGPLPHPLRAPSAPLPQPLRNPFGF
eukprot:1191240-Prorocentrum_minimum.AAC.1